MKLVLSVVLLAFVLLFDVVVSQQQEDVLLLDLHVDTTTGAYTVLVNGNAWFHSGDYAFHYDSKWFSTVDGSLELLFSYESKGMDNLGIYQETSLVWGPSGGDGTLVTLFKTYVSQSFVIFKQIFLKGLTNTDTGNNNDIITAFPTFKVENQPSLNYYTYRDTFALPLMGHWGSSTSYAGGIRGGIPLALFDSNLMTVMISPFDNFMVGIQTLSAQLNGQFACGLQGKIKSIPQGFSHSTILSVSQGVNAAHTYWGNLLLKFFGKVPKSVDDDFTVKNLGYWTDNGAYYYYHTESGKNYEDTMVDVYNYITSINLPVKYYQYDSWWYLKGHTNGLLLWEPMPTIFPDGIKSLQQKMGSTPIALHNRWFENDTYYYTKMGYPFIAEEGGYAVPSSEDAYVYLMSKAKDWGLIVYEQDWLVSTLIGMEATQNNVSVAANWMRYMDSAATQLGLTIQLCMPLPSQVLQSVKMYSVTQIRASDDYQRQVYDRNNWAIGYTSMLHHALGVFPFKDCFWSSNQTQTDCSDGICIEPNALLQTLVALMSTGPVGPADKIGFLDTNNIMQTCRSDGVLLKPDAPFLTMDLVFQSSFLSTSPLLYNLSHTSSLQFVDDTGNGALREVRWHYILAADTEISFHITPADVGEESNNTLFYVFDYFEQPTKLNVFSKVNPLVIPALLPSSADVIKFRYYVIVPSLGNSYTLIGERHKFAVASYQRFGQITKTTSASTTTTVINIYGAINESVTLAMFYQPSLTIEEYVCVVGITGTTTLSCIDASTGHKCTCYHP